MRAADRAESEVWETDQNIAVTQNDMDVVLRQSIFPLITNDTRP